MRKTKRTQKTGRMILKGGILLIALCGVLAAGKVVGLSAYFTDNDTARNTFTVGKVTIDVSEPSWTPDPDNITPNQSFQKDPTILNTGDNDAFVFMQVEVPCANVVTANADGTRNPQALTDFFSYEVNSGWTLMHTEDVSEKTPSGTQVIAHRYQYAYGSETACTALKPDEKTTLFDTVKYANLVEGQLEDQTVHMDIKAYAIQTTDLGDNGTVVSKEVFSILCNQVK